MDKSPPHVQGILVAFCMLLCLCRPSIVHMMCPTQAASSQLLNHTSSDFLLLPQFSNQLHRLLGTRSCRCDQSTFGRPRSKCQVCSQHHLAPSRPRQLSIPCYHPPWFAFSCQRSRLGRQHQPRLHRGRQSKFEIVVASVFARFVIGWISLVVGGYV